MVGSVLTEKGEKMQDREMSREEAIKRLEEGAPFSELYDSRWEDALALAIKALKAEPVRHGHWTEERNPMMYQLNPYVWVCDQCGTAFYYKTPYCGECGAKMDEEEK